MSSRTDRACLVCGIVKPYREFASKGCPNCESILNFTSSDENMAQDCTSPSFEGLVALGEPSNSWVARWLRIDGFQPGIYAVRVSGRLPEEVVQDLAANGVTYRPRDGSAQD